MVVITTREAMYREDNGGLEEFEFSLQNEG